MRWDQANRWLSLFMLAGCGAKLQVGPGGGGSSGAAGATDIDSGGAGGCGRLRACSAGTTQTAGVAGGAGSVHGHSAGQRGQPCLPGGTATEADGTPAKTPIVTLNRCDNGLTCDETKHCVDAPDCPQPSGVCVVYGTPVEQDPRTGGGGGSGGGQGGTTMAESGIVAFGADDTHLYWLEYGTRDSLGNYQHDGALRAYDLSSAEVTTLADNLPGPNSLGITAGHAYVGADGGALIGTPPNPQVLRLPLGGGATEVVQESEAAYSFAAAGDQAYWATDQAIYTVAPSGTATPMQLHDSSASQLHADDTDLYYEAFSEGSDVILRQSQTGTSATQVAQAFAFALNEDSLYGVESLGAAQGMILDQVPKSGGNWTRQQALGVGDGPSLQIIADRYFVGAFPPHPPGDGIIGADDSKAMILTGLLSSNAPPVRLVEAAGRWQGLIWQATATSLFWTDGRAIFSRPVTDK